MVSDYKREAIFASRGLKKLVNDVTKPEDIRNAAKHILEDHKEFKKYVLIRIERQRDKIRKKLIEEKRKNLSGWKKWFKMILPDSIILR